MTALKIETSGKLLMVEITGDTIKQQNESIYQHLGGYFDIVRLRNNDAVMLVDDEGLLKALPINTMAMMLSDYPRLVGTALIVGLMPTEDGDVFTDCPAQYLRFAEQIAQARKKPHPR